VDTDRRFSMSYPQCGRKPNNFAQADPNVDEWAPNLEDEKAEKSPF